MTDITRTERDTIIHAIGLTKRGKARPRWSSRNYYAADADDAVCAALVAKGFLRRWCGPNSVTPYTIFRVTPTGAMAAGVGNRMRREDQIGNG